MGHGQRTADSYLGSVRFFKHLILGVVGAMIAIPTILSVVLAVLYTSTRASAMDAPIPTPTVQETVTPPVAEPSPTPSSAPATEAPPWQSLYPELRAPEADRSSVDEGKTCYLTFDDGPSARTPEILAILEKYNVKATFFVVGKTDEQAQQWMRDIVAAGHTLGIHSYTHDYKKIYASAEDFLEDYNEIYELIYDATGTYPTVSRFPGGSINGYNGAHYAEMISELVRRGFVYFDWNVATGDAAEHGLVPASTLIHNALDRVGSLRRAVVLMHDSAGKTTTVEALPAIIEGYQNEGFTLKALTPEVVPVVYSYPN